MRLNIQEFANRPERLLAVACLVVIGLIQFANATNSADIPVLEISTSTTLDPTKSYGRLVIKVSDISIDGNGASVVGSSDGDSKTFKGIGVEAAGISNIVLKNLKVRGFETGLRVENARNWAVENCDFSGNFDDPSFGWGQLSRRGGIVFLCVSNSKIVNCRANKNWVGCILERSDDNRLEGNDFSHSSEACLELWQATRNTFKNNKLDYGNRAKPDEVHARDSCCVLIESGSDGNTFADNSCTHGGDGIFVRCLNGWISTGNQFLRNDCSYGHNHGVECWCPGNIFDSNMANHCSYGFWMGGSDRTVMVNNEACFNGDPKGNHFSPHLPDKGHAGIVFMHGSGTHIVLRNNRCVGNNGAGIALIGDRSSKGAKWKAHHWVIDGNTLSENRWGIFAQFADWIDLGGNTIEKNTLSDFQKDVVTNVTERPADPAVKSAPNVIVNGPVTVKVGQRVMFDASKSNDSNGRPLSYCWRVSDGTIVHQASFKHAFSAAGFYRVGVTVSNGVLSNLGSCDVFVVADGPEIGTEESAAGRWDWVDPQSKVQFADDTEIKIIGQSSLRADVGPYGGGRVELRYTMPANEIIDPKKKSHLEFWLRSLNSHIPCWQGENPIVTLYGSDNSASKMRPKNEIINWTDHPECRDGWLLVRIPLAGDETWTVEGSSLNSVTKVSFSFDSWGARPFQVWLDGMRFE